MTELVPQPKPWYLSKTILVQILSGVGLIAGVFVPAVGQFIQTYFAELGSGWAFVNIILRLITKKEIG
jgi:hypothetical protein